MDYKNIIIKIQQIISYILRYKIVVLFLLLVVLGIIVGSFTNKTRNIAKDDFYMRDSAEKTKMEISMSEEMAVSMQEVNRNAKLLSFFFDDLISNKKYYYKGISEEYEKINDFDMQIIGIEKSENGYRVLVQIGIPKENVTERIYIPFKKYIVNVDTSSTGLKVGCIVEVVEK